MPRPLHSEPSYCLDKSDGRAYVVINRRRIRLGRHNTPESLEKYHRVLAEWRAAGSPRGVPFAPQGAGRINLTLNQLAAMYLAAMKQRRPDLFPPGRRPAEEAGNIIEALRPLLTRYGSTPAADFGPKALRTLRAAMVAEMDPKDVKRRRWQRETINSHVVRIRAMFRWGVADELLAGHAYERLKAVAAMKHGETDARERVADVSPVDEDLINATLPHLARQVQAMINLQLLTGMRPGEVCRLHGAEIDAGEEIWIYAPGHHKTARFGHKRTIWIGPRAQGILEPFLKPGAMDFCFSPSDAESDRRAALAAKRITPRNQGNRAGTNRKSEPKRSPKDRYTAHSYRQAIQRACDLAFPAPPPLRRRVIDAATGRMESERLLLARLTPEQRADLRTWRKSHRWHPHQLRHNFATTVASTYGEGMVGTMIGDKTPRMVRIYAERDARKAARIAAEIG